MAESADRSYPSSWVGKTVLAAVVIDPDLQYPVCGDVLSRGGCDGLFF